MSLGSTWVGGSGSGGVGGGSLLNGLVASWSFDADPFVARIVTPDFDFVNTGTPTAVAGKLSNGAQLGFGNHLFNTSGQANGPLKLNQTSEFTIAFWFKQTHFSASFIFDFVYKATPNGYHVSLSSSNLVSFNVNGAVTFDTNPVLENTWYFVTAKKKDNSDISLRISTEAAFDEVLDTVAFGLTYVPNTTIELRVGSNTGVEGHQVIMDELNMWSRYLSEAEERWLWNNGTGRAYPFS